MDQIYFQAGKDKPSSNLNTPKSLKLLLDMPAPDAKRHAPGIPELFSDLSEL